MAHLPTTETSSSAKPGAVSKTTTSKTFATAEAYAKDKGVSIKPGSDLSSISAASVATFGVVANVAKNLGLPGPVVTAGRDGVHSAGSLHYSMPSKALDYRGNNVTNAQLSSLAQGVGNQLGTDYDAIAEFKKDPTKDHLHVEYDP